jgi:uncharacterized protein (TIGR00730 family)
MSELRNICVYCGSRSGIDPDFVIAARRLGKILAEKKIGLVYGGGSMGLMGALAWSVYDHGGEIIGVIPGFLRQQEVMFELASELVVTRDMHERKRIMFDRADAFVALPGGIGTLEELVEQLTWAQLGHHKKPILLANINGCWDALIDLLRRMDALSLIPSETLMRYRVCDAVEDIVPMLRAEAARLSEVEKAGEPALVERM